MRYIATDNLHVDKAAGQVHRSPVFRGGNIVTTPLVNAHESISAADVQRYDLLAAGVAVPVPDSGPAADIAEGGNGDTARRGVDTTGPGTLSGGNIVGTDLEGLSEDELEERGVRVSDAYKRRLQQE